MVNNMSVQQYKVNSREYSTRRPPLDTPKIFPNKNYLFELPYLAVMTVKGEPAGDFLQGQLSCDVREVDDKTMRHGALCNLKGRVLALLDVVKWHGYQLILPKDLLEDTQSSLAKVALVSRVSLHQNLSCKVYGFLLSNDNDLQPDNLTLSTDAFSVTSNESVCAYSLGDNFYLLLVTTEKAPSLMESFSLKEQLLYSLEWHHLQLERLRIEIYPQTRAVFLPHRVDLHKSAYLNFNKGCYKGQEIIARTHYRAKLKHGLFKFIIHTKEMLTAGMKIFNLTNDAELGELIDFSPLSADNYLIAISIVLEHPTSVIFEGHSIPILLTAISEG